MPPSMSTVTQLGLSNAPGLPNLLVGPWVPARIYFSGSHFVYETTIPVTPLKLYMFYGLEKKQAEHTIWHGTISQHGSDHLICTQQGHTYLVTMKRQL